MRISSLPSPLLFALTLLVCGTSGGQVPGPVPVVPAVPTTTTPAPGVAAPLSWEAVKHLPTGEPIRVDSAHFGQTCEFVSANDDDLTCLRVRGVQFFTYTQRSVVPRLAIRRIRYSHQVRARVVGGAIGAGLGFGFGSALSAGFPTAGNFLQNHILGILFAVTGANLGQGIGGFFDFLAGPELYRAP